jgi:hypothetical protein
MKWRMFSSRWSALRRLMTQLTLTSTPQAWALAIAAKAAGRVPSWPRRRASTSGRTRVDRDVDDAQAGVGEGPRERGVGEPRAVGDHADVQAALRGVGGDRGQLGVQGRLAAGEDHAEVAAPHEVVDQHAHRLEGVGVRRRGVAAEPAEVVAVADDLDVAEVRQDGRG